MSQRNKFSLVINTYLVVFHVADYHHIDRTTAFRHYSLSGDYLARDVRGVVIELIAFDAPKFDDVVNRRALFVDQERYFNNCHWKFARVAVLRRSSGGGSVVSPLAAAHDAAPYGVEAVADVGGHGCCP